MINLRDIEKIAEKTGKKKINISELGYDKVLGKGQLTEPLEIEARFFSEKAKMKIEKNGGKVIIIGQEKNQ